MKRIMWVLSMALICVVTSAVTTAVLSRGVGTPTAVAAETPPVVGICASPDKELDAIWPDRMARIRQALAEAKPASVVLFDANGDVLETYPSEEIFLYTIWRSSMESSRRVDDLYHSLDTAFASKPTSWVNVHETVDGKDLDGDGKISKRNQPAK